MPAISGETGLQRGQFSTECRTLFCGVAGVRLPFDYAEGSPEHRRGTKAGHYGEARDVVFQTRARDPALVDDGQ